MSILERFRPDGREGVTCTADDLFTLLSNERRRNVIAVLHHNRERAPLALGTLAEAGAFIESDYECLNALTSEERKALYVALYQNHLEPLAEAGVIAWDERANTVAPARNLDGVVEEMTEIEAACAGRAER